MKKISVVLSTVVFVAATVACSQQTPARPSETAAAATAADTAASTTRSVTDDLTGVTLTSPVPVSPSDGQALKFAEQPLKLVVKNAVATGAAALTYSFQVASDAAFASVVFSQDGVAEGGNGQTSVSVSKLPGAKTYFWHARASSGGSAGLFSAGRTFSIGPEVVLQTPVLASPGSGGSVSGTPLLTVNNVQRSGPVTAITYRFDVADSSSFGHIVFTTTVGEQSGATSASVNATLSAGTYFWRVQATDNASSVSSPISAASVFTYQPFSLAQATVLNSPADLASWAETARITRVEFTGNAMIVDFDKREGPDRWPDTPFGDGNLEYTLGLCLDINGHWYCSAVVQFWFGRDLEASGQPSDFFFEWWYDGARWGPMAGYRPADGETVGVFVCAGNCRNNTAGDASYVKERSNVVFVPFANHGGGSYTFSAGSRIKSSSRP
jgi:hypothetical protein